jgi:hypothetical protein
LVTFDSKESVMLLDDFASAFWDGREEGLQQALSLCKSKAAEHLCVNCDLSDEDRSFREGEKAAAEQLAREIEAALRDKS